MLRALRLSVVWVLGAALAACGGASRDPGLAAYLRVDSAQFVAGPMPEPNGGPALLSARVPHNRLIVGSVTEHVSGSAALSATAVAIGREHDAGYFILTTGVPTAEEPEVPSYRGLLELARNFPVGPFVLQLSAVDRAGRLGPQTRLELEAVDSTPDGALVIGLRWDNDADLDLHVQDPSGVDIWARNINSWEAPPPGAPRAGAGAWLSGGVLDFDSNAGCSADGRSAEYVRFADAPPAGEYQVRVATASLCTATSAPWSVSVRYQGAQLAAASGIGLPTDTRSGAGARQGVLALTFVVP